MGGYRSALVAFHTLVKLKFSLNARAETQGEKNVVFFSYICYNRKMTVSMRKIKQYKIYKEDVQE